MTEHDPEIQKIIESDKAKQLYSDMYERIVTAGFGGFIDECVDLENVYPLTEKDGASYWYALTSCMVTSVGLRLEEKGINANDYGIPY